MIKFSQRLRTLAFVCLIFSTVYSTQAVALLPPYYQSVKEITAILKSPEVAQKMNSPYPISKIIKTETGYTISVQDCTLEVKIIYKHRIDNIAGPAEFEIEPGEKQCNNSKSNS